MTQDKEKPLQEWSKIQLGRPGKAPAEATGLKRERDEGTEYSARDSRVRVKRVTKQH